MEERFIMGFDFARGAKTTGSKFYFNIGDTAAKEWHLISEMIQWHITYGCTFVIHPYLINKDTATSAGLLPRFKDEFYETTDGFILAGTAEHPLVGMHKDEIFSE